MYSLLTVGLEDNTLGGGLGVSFERAFNKTCHGQVKLQYVAPVCATIAHC
jgi:hypothetical protein